MQLYSFYPSQLQKVQVEAISIIGLVKCRLISSKSS